MSSATSGLNNALAVGIVVRILLDMSFRTGLKLLLSGVFQARQQKEPSMTHEIPDTPWSKVGQYRFTLGYETYLATVDYYSDYSELDTL